MISESEALDIATQYLDGEYQASGTSISIADRAIELKVEDEGLAMLGLSGSFYTVTFHLDNPPDSFDPDYIILLVDAESGEPLWFPGEH